MWRRTLRVTGPIPPTARGRVTVAVFFSAARPISFETNQTHAVRVELYSVTHYRYAAAPGREL